MSLFLEYMASVIRLICIRSEVALPSATQVNPSAAFRDERKKSVVDAAYLAYSSVHGNHGHFCQSIVLKCMASVVCRHLNHLSGLHCVFSLLFPPISALIVKLLIQVHNMRTAG